jgi:hypothetical protein
MRGYDTGRELHAGPSSATRARSWHDTQVARNSCRPARWAASSDSSGASSAISPRAKGNAGACRSWPGQPLAAVWYAVLGALSRTNSRSTKAATAGISRVVEDAGEGLHRRAGAALAHRALDAMARPLRGAALR